VLARHMAIEMSMDRKQYPHYLGPYEVVARTRKGNYRLKELSSKSPMLHFEFYPISLVITPLC